MATTTDTAKRGVLRAVRDIDGGSWGVLAAAVGVVALWTLAAVDRLSIPTDGWSIGYDAQRPTEVWFARNERGAPSLLREGDRLVAVGGVPIEQVVRASFAPRPPSFPVSPSAGGVDAVRYTVLRAGERLDVDAPVVRESFDGHLAQLGRLLLTGPSTYGRRLFVGPAATAALPLFLLGAFVFFKRPRNPAGRLLFLFGAGWFCQVAIEAANMDGVERFYGGGGILHPRPLGVLWAIVFLPMLPLAFLLFPVAKWPMRRYPSWTVALLFGTPLAAVLVALWRTGDPSVALPAMGPLHPLMLLVVPLSAAHTLMTARGDVRSQMLWVTWGAVMSVGGTAVLGWVEALGAPVPPLAYGSAFLMLPLAMAVAILRHRLFDVEVVVGRTLVYGTLIFAVAGLHALVVGGARGLVGPEADPLLAFFTAGLVAVLFQPARDHLQRGANRLLYGDRENPYDAIARLGRTIGGVVASDALLPAVVEQVARALKLPHASIWIADGGALRLAAHHGTPPPRTAAEDPGAVAILRAAAAEVLRTDLASSGEYASLLDLIGASLVVPLTHQGELVGALALAARRGEERFSAADRRLLRDLGGHCGTAARGVQLTAALRASVEALRESRSRLITAQEEERRRIHRDLHDGLGPTLASIRLRIHGCLDDAGAAAPHLTAELERLDELVGQATADIRRLVYQLRPPVLDQAGLVGAVRQHVEHFGRDTGLEVEFDAPPRVEVGAGAEVAVFRVVQEALVNVQKHARAGSVRVRMAPDAVVPAAVTDAAGGWLVVELADDGIGLGSRAMAVEDRGSAAPGTGNGLRTMRERAELVGGTLEMDADGGGGTCVRLRVPVGA